MAYKPPPPDAERCEVVVRGHGYWGSGRCEKRSKFVVQAYPRDTEHYWQRGDFEAEPRDVRVCGVHRRYADKGGSLHVFTGKAKRGYSGGDSYDNLFTKPTDVEAIKAELAIAERDANWNRQAPATARTKSGQEVWEQAPEILEMLFMVAERGDERAWKAIHAIQDGMTRVEQADKAYQDLLDRIEALKARLEKAKEEQA